MATVSCHSNQSSYPIEKKNNNNKKKKKKKKKKNTHTIIRFPDLQMLYVKFGKDRLQCFRRDVV